MKKSLKEDKLHNDKLKMSEATTSKDQWKEAKQLVGWTSYGGPQMLLINGKPVTSPPKMANQLNIDYIVRAAKAARSTPIPAQDPMVSYRNMIGDKKLNLAFQPLGRLEVAQIIDAINPSKSSATDEISMRLLRKLKAPLLPAIQHLVNTTIISTEYPTGTQTHQNCTIAQKGKGPNPH